jgi:hypothetical protein
MKTDAVAFFAAVIFMLPYMIAPVGPKAGLNRTVTAQVPVLAVPVQAEDGNPEVVVQASTCTVMLRLPFAVNVPAGMVIYVI